MTLSFLDQIRRVLKNAQDIHTLKFIDCKIVNKAKLSSLQNDIAMIFPKLMRFIWVNTSLRLLLGDVFIELIPSTKDKSIDLLSRKKLQFSQLVIEDPTLERTYIENVYIDILRLWDPLKLTKIHIRWGSEINFSKFSPTLSFFFEEIDKFKNLKSLKISDFDLEEDNLIEFYTDTIQSFQKLEYLDLSQNFINDQCMHKLLILDEFEQ